MFRGEGECMCVFLIHNKVQLESIQEIMFLPERHGLPNKIPRVK